MQCQCPYLPTVQSSSQAKSKKSYSPDNVNYLTLLLHCKPWLVPLLSCCPPPTNEDVRGWTLGGKITLRQFSTNQCAHLNRNVYNKQLLENVPILLTTQHYCIKPWLCYMCCASVLSFVQFLFFIVSPSFPYTTIFQKQRKIKIEPQHTSHFN